VAERGKMERRYPEMSDSIPVKCETCRFWTEHVGNQKPWGSCGLIGSGSREQCSAYLTGEFASETLHTLPHFYCSLWAEKLADTVCRCGEQITFVAHIAKWRHIKTGLCVCAGAKLNNGEYDKWAEPARGAVTR